MRYNICFKKHQFGLLAIIANKFRILRRGDDIKYINTLFRNFKYFYLIVTLKPDGDIILNIYREPVGRAIPIKIIYSLLKKSTTTSNVLYDTINNHLK